MTPVQVPLFFDPLYCIYVIVCNLIDLYFILPFFSILFCAVVAHLIAEHAEIVPSQSHAIQNDMAL
jgi:hypothetical protein